MLSGVNCSVSYVDILVSILQRYGKRSGWDFQSLPLSRSIISSSSSCQRLYINCWTQPSSSTFKVTCLNSFHPTAFSCSLRVMCLPCRWSSVILCNLLSHSANFNRYYITPQFVTKLLDMIRDCLIEGGSYFLQETLFIIITYSDIRGIFGTNIRMQ